mgnify:CR=1 FL=1|jgi:DNA-binding transcriptional LysR family regulator
MSIIEDAMLFVKVIQAGSLTKAATQLSSSKSQISRRISALEQRLDATLMLRSAKGLQLTEQGEQFYQSCIAIQSQFNDATEKVQKDHKSIAGNIAITAPMSLGSLFLGPLIAKFMRNYPDVSVELDLSDTVKNFADSRFDLAIRAAPSLPDSSLYAKKLLSYGYAVVASPEYLDKHGTPSHPDELANHRVITCLTEAQSLTAQAWPFMINQTIQQVPVKSVARVTHMGVQKKMALESLGIIRVPTYWVKNEIESGLLTSILSDAVSGESHIFALYKSSKSTPSRLSSIITYLKQHLPGILT